MRRPLVALVVLLSCDSAELEPSTCSSWLACYDGCDPLEFAGHDDGDADFNAGGVQFCVDECGPDPSGAVVARDLELVDTARDDAARLQAAYDGLRARAACQAD